MSNDNQSEAVIEPGALCDPQPQLPALTNDGWELVQYRLWDAIRSKMWKTLTVFLTLVTLGGLLGIPAYISGRIDAKIAEEKEKFEALRSQLQEENAALQLRASLASHFMFRWTLDRAELQRLLILVTSEFGDSQLAQGDQREIASALRILLRRFPRNNLEGGDFCYEVRLIVDLLEGGALPDPPPEYSSTPLTRAEWAKFVRLSNQRNMRSLPQIYALHSHLAGLNLTMRKNYSLTMKPTLSEPLQRADFYLEYNSTVRSGYREYLNRVYSEELPPPWASSWSWLAESGNAAFFQAERELADSENDRASE